jgi:hypothetical protein
MDNKNNKLQYLEENNGNNKQKNISFKGIKKDYSVLLSLYFYIKKIQLKQQPLLEIYLFFFKGRSQNFVNIRNIFFKSIK